MQQPHDNCSLEIATTATWQAWDALGRCRKPSEIWAGHGLAAHTTRPHGLRPNHSLSLGKANALQQWPILGDIAKGCGGASYVLGDIAKGS